MCDERCDIIRKLNPIIKTRTLIVANEKTLEILKEMKKDPNAKELFGIMPEPAWMLKIITIYEVKGMFK